MISSARKAFNESFSDESYQQFLDDLNSHYNHTIAFRVAETPIFIDKALKKRMVHAAREINAVLMRPDFKEITKDAVPPPYNVPAENDHTLFFSLDFAICKDENGELTPQLIELQGCPSLYCYQDWVAKKFRKHYPSIPANYPHLGSGLDSERYMEMLGKAILGDHKPENVILLEIDPEDQYTMIDFICHEDVLGIKPVCITKVIKEGRKLFYMRDGVKTPIYRIYNRTIFDDLIQRKTLNPDFKLTHDVDVEWAGHPNWFFRISKYTMPFIKSQYVPETRFLHQVNPFPTDLENYVLKPLFSFAGSGVIFDVTQADIDAIPSAARNEYILQRKVEYAPVIQAPDGMVKCEVRMLFVWPEDAAEPQLVVNLGRLSRGKLIGVKYNKDKTWVGGTVCFAEPG